ncbi:uncharacterized protein ckn isoform X3 [Planococcus citri]|uniref:uncharacterized protein ckn isoform X3 n=1 Tax=Planococcus citri TaxID=170843 RepID=UPI0031F85A82
MSCIGYGGKQKDDDCTASYGAYNEDLYLGVGGMNRPQKCAPQIKKVAPPSVPDNSTYRHSGSSFSSAGYSSSGEDSCFSDPISKDGLDGGECYGMPGRSPNSQFNYPAFTFPGNGVPAGQYTQIHAAKNAVYYHHQLSLQEDQGIDMTQSPGRDSPGSSGSGSGSRHSTASVDSGRASGCHLTTPHCRSSMSTSSVGSVDHNIPAKVERLLQSGVPDHDVLHSWLLDLHFEEYFPLFVASGYDMPTIVRMTPEDLTAIGIKKPNHRKRLKAEIAQLKISDGLPEYIPGSLNEWLQLLRLEEYKPALASQGYETIEDVLQLTWEDLEDIGIVKLGHQKRLLLAIKRVKDLKAGKIFPKPSLNLIQTQVSIESHSPCSTVSSNVSYDLDCPRVHTTYHSFHQPWELETTQQLYYPTADIVPIKIRNPRGKSLESLKDGTNNVATNGTSSFVPGVPQQLPVFGWKYRSYDDGDITPTNENLTFHEGGGTLPRPRGLVRPRPVAKIPATLCQSYRNEEQNTTNEIKKKPPSPPKRHSESITVVADLHCTHIPPDPAPSTPPWSAEERQLIASLKAQGGSDSSFKSSSSSTESDSIPFANENAGTIKQRISRSNSEYSQSHIVNVKSALPTTESDISLKKLSKEPTDVLDDIGNMLANLTDELDAMLEEEKRQGLNDD